MTGRTSVLAGVDQGPKVMTTSLILNSLEHKIFTVENVRIATSGTFLLFYTPEQEIFPGNK